MHGLMQEWPLACHKIIDHAARQHPNREVVSRSVEGPIVRTTYAGVRDNARKIAQLLAREGFQPGDRIATLAWNTGRHLEAWFGIMGMGGVYHTLNKYITLVAEYNQEKASGPDAINSGGNGDTQGGRSHLPIHRHCLFRLGVHLGVNERVKIDPEI